MKQWKWMGEWMRVNVEGGEVESWVKRRRRRGREVGTKGGLGMDGERCGRVAVVCLRLEAQGSLPDGRWGAASLLQLSSLPLSSLPVVRLPANFPPSSLPSTCFSLLLFQFSQIYQLDTRSSSFKSILPFYLPYLLFTLSPNYYLSSSYSKLSNFFSTYPDTNW